MQKSEMLDNPEETHILTKVLADLQFSVWDVNTREGHSKFVGNVIETTQYLEHSDLDWLEVSALDLEHMHSLEPVSAVEWLIWYYETAFPKLEENDYDERVPITYPTKY